MWKGSKAEGRETKGEREGSRRERVQRGNKIKCLRTNQGCREGKRELEEKNSLNIRKMLKQNLVS